MTKTAEQWGTRLGLILAVSGSAVGLGNFLRFPGQAAANGGGVFMIPYFCALLLLGIPACWAEWTMGRYAGQFGYHSCPGIFAVIGRHPAWKYIGTLGVLVPIGVFMYYSVIEAWCLTYALSYLLGYANLGNDPSLYQQKSAELFASITGVSADASSFSGAGLLNIFIWAAVFYLNFRLIRNGLSGGIEKFCRWAMPLMLLCAAIVLVRVLTLGLPDPAMPERSVMNGLGFMWNPKSAPGESWYQTLFDPQVWLAASGQIFYTLSVGFGVIINYASYLKKKNDVVLSSLTSCATNEFFEVCLGGLITVTAAFVFLGASGALGGTFGLGFNALPIVFMYMPGGQVFGFLWFFMLFLAAITSSISIANPGIAFFQESLGMSRKSACSVLAVVTGLGATYVIYFSGGLAALDTMDFWIGTALLLTFATIQIILFGWVFGAQRGTLEANSGSDMKLPRVFPFIIKYVSPIYLLFILGMWGYQKLPEYLTALAKGGTPLYTVIFILLLLLAAFWVVSGRGSIRNAHRSQTEEGEII